MKLETVTFNTAVRLPDGRVEKTVSVQNMHQAKSYQVSFDRGLRTILVEGHHTRPRKGRSPDIRTWQAYVPLENVCTMIPADPPEPAPSNGKKIKK